MMQAQLSQEVKRADMLSAELSRQQDDTARKGSKQRATTDALGTSRSPAGDHIQLCCDTLSHVLHAVLCCAVLACRSSQHSVV